MLFDNAHQPSLLGKRDRLSLSDGFGSPARRRASARSRSRLRIFSGFGFGWTGIESSKFAVLLSPGSDVGRERVINAIGSVRSAQGLLWPSKCYSPGGNMRNHHWAAGSATRPPCRRHRRGLGEVP